MTDDNLLPSGQMANAELLAFWKAEKKWAREELRIWKYMLARLKEQSGVGNHEKKPDANDCAK